MAISFDKAYEALGKEDINVVRFADKLKGTVAKRDEVLAKVFQSFEAQNLSEADLTEVAMFAGKVAKYLGFPKA